MSSWKECGDCAAWFGEHGLPFLIACARVAETFDTDTQQIARKFFELYHADGHQELGREEVSL
jgi:hypothetical protein